MEKGPGDDYLRSLLPIGGRLLHFADRWAALGAPPALLSVVRGYRIPFSEVPPLVRLDDIPSRRFETPPSPRMDAVLQEMIDQSVAEVSTYRSGFLSRLFLTPKPDGSSRPIFNLRRLNEFLSPKKFRLVNHFTVTTFLQRNDFMVKIDLSQAYNHVLVKPSHRRFLLFVYRGKTYSMRCLPFGLATAPHIFAALTNWVACKMREYGLRVIVYLDDFLLAHHDPAVLARQADVALRLLRFLGWEVRPAKCVLSPTPEIDFLGIRWNPSTNRKCLPPDKVLRFTSCLSTVLASGQWDWTTGKHLLGLLSFAAFVIPFGVIHYRWLQLASRVLPPDRPAARLLIPARAQDDLAWWIQALPQSSPIFPSPPAAFVTTDASDWGWGYSIGSLYRCGEWSPVQRAWHINRKELFAVQRALVEQLPLLQRATVLVQTDNATVVSYINRQGGTKSRVLLRAAQDLFRLAEDHDILLSARYIPGLYNTIADCLSRRRPLPDWHLQPSVTAPLFRRWGTPAIDLFATHASKVVPRYASLSATDGEAEFVDAFSRRWNFPLAWVFPPPPLIPRVLHHLNAATGVFLVVVPKWERAFWRPDLRSRALAAPVRIDTRPPRLLDLATGLPPANAASIVLETWKIRGGLPSRPAGSLRNASFCSPPGALPP